MAGNLDQPLEQSSAQPGVGRPLGVPLHAHEHRCAGKANGLDHAVVAGGQDGELARISDGLAVVAGDRAWGELGLAGRGDDRVHGVVAMMGVGRECVGEVLVEPAAGEQGHHLHAQADGKRRDVWAVEERGDERGVESLARGVDGRGAGIGGDAEGLGAGVIAAGEDEGVEPFEIVWDEFDQRREDDRLAAGGVNSAGVGERALGPDAAGRGLVDVRGNGDEWAGHG